jgi:hypothetical protein
VAGRIPHSSAAPAVTLQGWCESAELQASAAAAGAARLRRRRAGRVGPPLTEDARTTLRALHSSEGILKAAFGLLDMQCLTDLPAAADHDDAMQVFYQSLLFDAQSQGVRQRIIDELERHTQLADE